MAAAAFVPVIFWNALRWLQTEEDPDAELLALPGPSAVVALPPMASRQRRARGDLSLSRRRAPATAGQIDRVQSRVEGAVGRALLP